MLSFLQRIDGEIHSAQIFASKSTTSPQILFMMQMVAFLLDGMGSSWILETTLNKCWSTARTCSHSTRRVCRGASEPTLTTSIESGSHGRTHNGLNPNSHLTHPSLSTHSPSSHLIHLPLTPHSPSTQIKLSLTSHLTCEASSGTSKRLPPSSSTPTTHCLHGWPNPWSTAEISS